MTEMPENVVTTYTNQMSVSVSNNDAVVTCRWTVPVYNEEGEVIGSRTVNEVAISLSKELLVAHAEGIIKLVDSLDSNSDKSAN